MNIQNWKLKLLEDHEFMNIQNKKLKHFKRDHEFMNNSKNVNLFQLQTLSL